MFHIVLHIYLFPGLLFLSLLGPRLPVLSVLLHQLFIIMNTQSRHPLSFRSIAHLDDIEAQELAGKLGLSPQGRRVRAKQENLIVRHGVLRRLEANQLNFVTQETKIITDFASNHLHEDRLTNTQDDARNRDIQNPFKIAETPPAQTLKRSGSFIDDFSNEYGDNDRLKDDYCRVWFQKLALQAHAFSLQQENMRKDELINQLRMELEQRGGGGHFVHPASQPHAPSHNKSSSHHPSFSFTPTPQSNPHWGPVHPNRNFAIQNRNF